MSFDQFIKNNLNPEQQKAVTPKDGILVVCAGAGSGKTRVITARMAYLIKNHDVQPQEILALTFTNKAAREMKERIAHFLDDDNIALPYVGTFHSYCLRVLKSNSHLLANGAFSLIDDSDQEKIIRSILSKNNLTKKVSVKQALSFISKIKNEAVTNQEKQEILMQNKILRDIYVMYEQEKHSAHCLDFDDLLLNTLTLFEQNSYFKHIFQKNVRHILIDEYQDTNKVQHALLKAMTKDENDDFALDSLCVVGDEDQSIYSWRGATVTNILNFKIDFPGAMSVTIDQNYRSTQPILSLANEVIQNNIYRNPKKLWSEKQAVDCIRLLSFHSSYQEAEAISLFVKQSHQKSALNNHAILYRSHFQSRAIEEALIRHSIPYKIMGGVQFYDRLEIKDLLAYLRLIVNPFDKIAFSRIINVPNRGLGDKTEEILYQAWDEYPFYDFKQLCEHAIDNSLVNKTKADTINSFLSIFDGLTGQGKASTALTKILKNIAYESYLHNTHEKEEAETKRENIKELVNGITYFEEQTQQNLDSFLEEVALLQEQMNSKDNSVDNVRLMTLHAAKGLEFETVILTGMEEGILPSGHNLNQLEKLEEERRLLYVGITRAKDRLLLTYAQNRYTFGQMTSQFPSRFIDEFSTQYLEKDDCTGWANHRLSTYFDQWFNNPRTNSKTTKSKSANTTINPSTATSKSSFGKLGSNNSWSVSQCVQHKSFGQGVIEKIEEKVDSTYLTIRFRAGIKKLDSKFVTNS